MALSALVQIVRNILALFFLSFNQKIPLIFNSSGNTWREKKHVVSKCLKFSASFL